MKPMFAKLSYQEPRASQALGFKLQTSINVVQGIAPGGRIGGSLRLTARCGAVSTERCNIKLGVRISNGFIQLT